MENETSEFETPAAPNKDMWLFLIVLDVIVLCVLGFLLYNHFSSRVFSAAPAPSVSVKTQTEEVPALEKVTVAETETVVVQPAAQEFVPQPEEKQMVADKDVVPVKAAVTQVVPAPVETTPVVQPAQPEQKQSIIVVPVNGSKYRRVTFRWFEPAERVSIVSGFTNRKPQALKKEGDYWETTLSIAPGTYKFLYIVDGKNTVDPYAAQKDGRSVLIVQ